MAQQPEHSAEGYGCFVLGQMALALPMRALREVVPLTPLSGLPTLNPAVIGGLNLRGVVVPVVDLRLVLGQAAEPLASPCVVIMMHEGYILGLLVAAVTGILQVSQAEVQHMRSDAGEAAICQGTLVRSDDAAMLAVLSPAAIAGLPHMPQTADPEPQRSRTDDGEHTEEAPAHEAEAHMPVMLVRCGELTLAMDAMAVAATLSTPHITPSALSQGHCKGVIEHAGMSVPAVDLLAMLNLRDSPSDDTQQAFVLNTADGAVAFLISEVMDVVRCRRDAVVHMPAFALPHPELFEGTLPLSALPADVTGRCRVHSAQFLMINAAALRTQELVCSLASVAHMRHGHAAPGASAQGADARSFARTMHNGQSHAHSLLTYTLAGEVATPLSQIQEIVPYRADMAVFQGHAHLLGMLVHRGMSIPVMNLCGMLNLPTPEITSDTSVLLVESAGESVGFAVPQLRSIESTEWTPQAEAQDGVPAAHRASGLLNTRQLAKVGSAGEARMLPVLDLQAMARQLQNSPQASTPSAAMAPA